MSNESDNQGGLLSGLLDPVGATLETALSPVGAVVSGVTKPVTDTVGGVVKPLVGGVVGGVMDAGKQAGEGLGGAGDVKTHASGPDFGGKRQTASNPLGL